MKKIYFLLAAMSAIGAAHSQVTLTKASNGFVTGDVIQTTGYDTTTAIPKNTGANQVWNFTSLSAATFTSVKSYTNASEGAGNSNFPSATLAELKGGTETGYYNTAGANLEFLGFYESNGPSVISLTNTAVMAAWPISYGSTNNDLFAGSITSGTTQTAISGAVSYTANGTGTVIVPGNITYNNCLLIVRTLSVNLGSGIMFEKTYSFYTPAFKFPIVEFVYEQNTSGSDFEFQVLTSAITGLNENTEVAAQFNLYPNPTSTELNITGIENVISAEIIDMYGKKVMNVTDSSNDISTLEKGVYTVVIKHEGSVITKKLIKN